MSNGPKKGSQQKDDDTRKMDEVLRRMLNTPPGPKGPKKSKKK